MLCEELLRGELRTEEMLWVVPLSALCIARLPRRSKLAAKLRISFLHHTEHTNLLYLQHIFRSFCSVSKSPNAGWLDFEAHTPFSKSSFPRPSSSISTRTKTSRLPLTARSSWPPTNQKGLLVKGSNGLQKEASAKGHQATFKRPHYCYPAEQRVSQVYLLIE